MDIKLQDSPTARFTTSSELHIVNKTFSGVGIPIDFATAPKNNLFRRIPDELCSLLKFKRFRLLKNFMYGVKDPPPIIFTYNIFAVQVIIMFNVLIFDYIDNLIQ